MKSYDYITFVTNISAIEASQRILKLLEFWWIKNNGF